MAFVFQDCQKSVRRRGNTFPKCKFRFLLWGLNEALARFRRGHTRPLLLFVSVIHLGDEEFKKAAF